MRRVPNSTILLDGKSLKLEQIVAVARRGYKQAPKVKLSPKSKKKIRAAYDYVQSMAQKTEAIYGVNTGFGLLSDVKISKDKLSELQVNLLRSHASGVGDPFAEDIVRAALLLRANTLAAGYSGCSVELVEAILKVLNAGIVPWVPNQGSVGACGDLAPLAHLSLVLIGEGKAYYNGKLMSGAQALKKAGLKKYKLQAKEGLSLINGTQIMTAIGSLVLQDALELMQVADIATAMSVEAFRGTFKAFDPKVHALRPHPQQAVVAKNLIKLAKKSEIGKSHKDCDRVQDPYSFRCVPQVHGVSRQILLQAISTLETECNSVTDNPIVFTPQELKRKGSGPQGGEIISAGNFHGQYVAMIMDTVCIAIAELANISDQRMQKLINPNLSQLPAFLTEDPGLNSGMMIVQVAAASLVSENKILAHPASVDSIPTSADKEDHVSMGVTAARKARKILKNTQNVLAMELLCASQGLEFLKPLKPGIGIKSAYDSIRKEVKPIKQDRAFHEDIEKIQQLISSGNLLRNVVKASGRLN